MPVKIEIEYDGNLSVEEKALLHSQEDEIKNYLGSPLGYHDGRFRWTAMVNEKNQTLLSLHKVTVSNDQMAFTTEKELKRDPAEIHWEQYPEFQSFTRKTV